MPPPPITPLAVEVIRAAMIATDEGGDVMGLATVIRRKSTGWNRNERLRLVTAIAAVGAALARQLPDDVREDVLRLAAETV